MEQIDLLQKALDGEGIPYTADTLSHFGVYFTLLLNWNRRINLISKSDEDRIITRHFLQSIGLVRVVDFPVSAAVMDLGSGGGFPGIPLKLIRPDLHVYLVESKQKKGRFLQTVIDELSLPLLEVIHRRAEERSGEMACVDFIVCRAVTDLVTLIRWSHGNLRKEGGRLIVIKGEGVHDELKELERSAPDLGVAKWNALPYNPFPAIFTLENSYVFDAEIRLI